MAFIHENMTSDSKGHRGTTKGHRGTTNAALVTRRTAAEVVIDGQENLILCHRPEKKERWRRCSQGATGALRPVDRLAE